MLDRTAILALAGARVLVIGDIMVDLYLDNVPDRLSSEACVPVLRRAGSRLMLGGAGNVVSNLQALGAEVSVLTVCGPIYREEIAARLENVAGVLGVEDGRDIIKTRIMAGTQQLARLDQESPRPLSPEAETEVLNALAALDRQFDVICIADYAKGVVTRRVWLAALATHKPVLVDAKVLGQNWAGAALVKPNLAEISHAFGRRIAGDDMVAAAAREVQSKAQVGAVLVTRGAEGMTLVRDTGSVHHIRSKPTPVYDVTGAGDTVLAVLGIAMARGVDLGEAAQLANVAGGLVVAKPGTATVSLEELAATASLPLPAKVAALEHATRQTNAWKAARFTVGFTNGCFDLLHAGHVHLLTATAFECDRLIVGLASDAHVRELKGDGRPVQSFAERAAALARVSTVSLIVECDTPADALKALGPDFLLRGYDQSVAPEDAKIMEECGGKIVRLDELPGHSTTAQIEGRAA